MLILCLHLRAKANKALISTLYSIYVCNYIHCYLLNSEAGDSLTTMKMSYITVKVKC